MDNGHAQCALFTMSCNTYASQCLIECSKLYYYTLQYMQNIKLTEPSIVHFYL